MNKLDVKQPSKQNQRRKGKKLLSMFHKRARWNYVMWIIKTNGYSHPTCLLSLYLTVQTLQAAESRHLNVIQQKDERLNT